MDIVCSIDDNYVQHCSCMLVSFFENNKSGNHTVHLLSEGLSPASIASLTDLVESYHGQFRYYCVASEKISLCPIKATDHLSVATYYRLLMAELLPPALDKVLYLDCDIVIDGSLDEFWNTPLDGYALAAVEEMNTSAKDAYERLGYDSRYGYFNAGVLLVNLAYWRKEKLTESFFEFIGSRRKDIRAHDQDVLNALLHDKCLHVSPKWNVEEAFYHYYVIKAWRKRNRQEVKEVLLHPVILHFTWKPKPWDKDCRHPFRMKYFDYLAKLPSYAHLVPSDGERRRAWKDLVYFKWLIRLGISGHRRYVLQ